ncbi:MAG: glucose-6-phosphate dehydrogenase, partial [Patescibacteria group bacterium]
ATKLTINSNQIDLLPENFYIVGFSRRAYSNEEFKEFLWEGMLSNFQDFLGEETAWKQFGERIFYQQGEFDNESGYRNLIDLLSKFDKELNACIPRYFYLATPPQNYSSILTYLHQTKLSEGCGQGSDKWTKVILEKPFGRSLEEAIGLDQKLSLIFKEGQIYRMDHYLGKETVQNILAFRYSNTIFDPVWNRQYIDSVQITIAERLGVETRGNFYEGVGALRDMVQSHLLELLAAIAMKPQVYDGEGIRRAREKIIESLVLIEPNEVGEKTVRGQYDTGTMDLGGEDDTEVVGYRGEPKVHPASNTETFVALKVMLDDSRWEDVPFYVRTGKRLQRKVTEIAVIFKQPSHQLFTGSKLQVVPNVLTFRIEPNEGIEVELNAKKPGFLNDFNSIPLNFSYSKETDFTDAYERLLLDSL